MIEAWHRRDVQRQALIEKLINKVCDEGNSMESDDSSVRNFKFDLSIAMLYCLKYGGMDRVVLKDILDISEELVLFLFNDILGPINDFARADSERNVLIDRLLQQVISYATQEFHSALHSEELDNPQKIFHVSRMAMVPLEEEE